MYHSHRLCKTLQLSLLQMLTFSESGEKVELTSEISFTIFWKSSPLLRAKGNQLLCKTIPLQQQNCCIRKTPLAPIYLCCSSHYLPIFGTSFSPFRALGIVSPLKLQDKNGFSTWMVQLDTPGRHRWPQYLWSTTLLAFWIWHLPSSRELSWVPRLEVLSLLDSFRQK